MISIIIPTYNEQRTIEHCLQTLAPYKKTCEIIVVDGGSTDKTVSLAKKQRVKVVLSKKGRATQLNTGALESTGDVLLFLHADTQLPKKWDKLVSKALKRHGGGGFYKRFRPSHLLLTINSWKTNFMSRVFNDFLGDNALFVKRDVFFAMKGFPQVPLLEDLIFSNTLKHYNPTCIPAKVSTSSRRFKGRIISSLVRLMVIRLLFSLGVSPKRLAKVYYA